MTKTVWMIHEETNEKNYKTELTYYHFGKAPKFPSWYMEENAVYSIEMIWNLKLVNSFKMFFKCLTHFYTIK